MGTEHKCQWCGKEFEPTCHKSRQKFCSAECRIKYHNAKRYYGGKVDVCPECGAPVEQSGERGRWRRFCSDRCRQVSPSHLERQKSNRYNGKKRRKIRWETKKA